MKISLILSQGYVSSKIQKYWNSNRSAVFSVSRSSKDYLKEDEFKEMLDGIKPDYLINGYGFTGKPNVDSCELKAAECYKRNVTDNLKILELAQKHNIPIITISSGCIYNDDMGEREFTEEDPHNFGWTNPSASWYSKTKSKFEMEASPYLDSSYILRIRMPFDDDLKDDKNYIGKILKYDKLVNYKNSLTHLEDLTKFIQTIVEEDEVPRGIYNVVNDLGITAEDIIKLYKAFGGKKEIDRWYSTDDLLSMKLMKCRRSNCVLDNKKISDVMKMENSFYRVEKAIWKRN